MYAPAVPPMTPLPPNCRIHLAGRRLTLSALLSDRRNQPGTVSLVITQAVNVNPQVVRVRLDLEVDRKTVVDADVSSEALERGWPRPLRSHWLRGAPANRFSVTIAFCANAQFTATAVFKVKIAQKI